MSADVSSIPTDDAVPAGEVPAGGMGPTNDAGKPTGRRVFWRAFIYIAAVHLFAALLFAMFAIGARTR